MQFNATPEQFQHLFNKLAENYMTNEPSHFSYNFTTSGHSIIAQVNYDSAAEELTVEIVHKPFYITEHEIENGMQEYLDSMPNAAASTGETKDKA